MHLIGISSLHILYCNFLKNFTFLLFLHWTLCIVIHMKDLFTHFWYGLIDENLEGKMCLGKLVMMDINFTKKVAIFDAFLFDDRSILGKNLFFLHSTCIHANSDFRKYFVIFESISLMSFALEEKRNQKVHNFIALAAKILVYYSKHNNLRFLFVIIISALSNLTSGQKEIPTIL